MSRPTPLVFTDREPGSQVRNQTPLTSYTAGSQAWHELFGPSGGLPAVTEQSALQISAVYACVNLIAGVIAALPIKAYSRDPDGQLDELPSDDLWWLLNEEMLPRWSAADGWEFTCASRELRGDGIAKIHRTQNGATVGIEPLHYDRVTPIPTADGRRLVYVVEPDPLIPNNRASREVLDQDDVLHFSGFGFNGVRGLSPLRSALRMAAPVALSAQEYAARFFSNGARPDYFLSTEAGTISPESVQRLRDQIDERHRNPNGWHRPMIGTNGLKPHTLSLPADEIALLPQRQFQIEEIARIYQVPPFMIGHTEKVSAWGSGLEAMGKGFVRYSLGPRLNKVANELNRKLIRNSRKVVAFDPAELEAGDWKSLIEGFRAALGRAGEDSIMTVEEIRERLRLRRKPSKGTLGKGSGNAPQPAEPARP